MTKYLEASGKTEQAAIDAALEQLGLDRDEVSVEILERAKTGFLGIGSTLAKVRVSYEGPDDEPQEAAAPAAPEKVVYEAPKEAKAQKPEPKPILEPEPTHPVDDEASQAIVAFVSGHSGISAGAFEMLMLKKDDMAADVGSVIYGQEAVELGLIDRIGGLHDALECLHQMIGEEKNHTCPKNL